jgi:hypothetical protein
MVTPRLAQKLFRSRFGEGLNTLAANKGLETLRVQLDVLFTRLVFRVFSRKR